MRYKASMGVDYVKIARLRKAKRLTQEEAARGAGLSGRARWNDVETGRHTNLTVQTLDRIAKALGVKARELLK